MPKLLVFDSHPVQYRVPVWKEINKFEEGCLHVCYATDCSVKGHDDTGFGKKITWDEPLLSGYIYTVLNCVSGTPLSGWKSLTGKGVGELLEKVSPNVVLLTGFNYKYDLIAYLESKRKGVQVWLRCETQDQASNRSSFKKIIRFLMYRILYLGIDKFFYIGELNKKHYLTHGVNLEKLFPALYCTVDRIKNLTESEKNLLRLKARDHAGFNQNNLVIGFSGKFI